MKKTRKSNGTLDALLVAGLTLIIPLFFATKTQVNQQSGLLLPTITVLMRRTILFFAFLFLIPFNMSACSNYEGMQPVVSHTPYSTLTPITPFATTALPTSSATVPVPTEAATATSDVLSACNVVSSDGNLLALGNDVFFFEGPGDEELDRTLAEHYPEWADYKQTVEWDAEPVKLSRIIMSASFEETFALNPAVNLVTVGMSLNWELPPDGDVYSRALATGEKLVGLWYEWTNPGNEQIRARYPDISNGSTYALYVFFDYDKEKLQVWCDTYQRLFGVSPLHR